MLVADEPDERGRLQVPVGHDQGGPGQQAGVGQAPGVGVEHGHHGQHAVPLGKGEGIPQAGAHRVQVAGPVAVDDALGVPGGPAGVAHRRGRTLVERWPVERVGLGGEQVLVAVHAHTGELVRAGRLGERAAGHDHVLDRGRMRQDLGEPGDQRRVHDDNGVFRVGGDVADLGRGEPDVQRVQHRAHGGHGQVGLKVLSVVPHEGADTLVGVDPQPTQGVGQPRGPAAGFGVSTTSGPVPGPGDNLSIAEYGRSVPHDRRDRQREIHHRAPHRPTSSRCLTCIPDSAMSQAPGSRPGRPAIVQARYPGGGPRRGYQRGPRPYRDPRVCRYLEDSRKFPRGPDGRVDPAAGQRG